MTRSLLNLTTPLGKGNAGWGLNEKGKPQETGIASTMYLGNTKWFFLDSTAPNPTRKRTTREDLGKKSSTGFLDQLVSLFSSLCTAAPLPNSTDYNYFRNERRSELD